jgi:RNA polymerase sigma factor (TIGR02999 family)
MFWFKNAKLFQKPACEATMRMMTNLPSANEIPCLLAGCGAGDVGALGRLTPLIYAELKTLASRALRGERNGHTLQTTALVNEACLRLLGRYTLDSNDRAQFIALAARTMRHVLVDYARQHAAAKRPSPERHIAIDEIDLPAAETDLIGLNAALERLSRINPRQAQVVDLKFFAGLALEQIAQTLGVTQPTVTRDWRMARAWLLRELEA